MRIRGTGWILLSLMAAAGWLGFHYLRLEADLHASRAAAAQSARALTVERERGQQLRERIERLETEAEIERLARERLGLTRSGEIRYSLQRDTR